MIRIDKNSVTIAGITGSGISTEAKQDTMITALGAINTNTAIDADITSSQVFNGAGEDLTISCQGYQSFLFQIVGAFTGTFQILGSLDGTTFQAMPFYEYTGQSAQITAAAIGHFAGSLQSFTTIKIRSITLSSGTPTVFTRCSKSPGPQFVISKSSAGFQVLPIQLTHDNLNLNANLQIANVDIPGNHGASTANVPRVTQASKSILTVSGTENSSGETSIVAAAGSGVKIKVLSYKLTSKSGTEVLATWLDGSAGTEIYRTRVASDGSLSLGETNYAPLPAGLFATSDNTALILNLSGAVAVDYSLSYIEEA